MRKAWAVLGTVIFFFLAPGIVAFLIPWLLVQWDPASLWPSAGWAKWAGLAIGALGTGELIECFARFALQGEGTPAPVAPTKHLVVTGAYRHVRNPMYVAVVAIILGWALCFGSPTLFLYAAIVWLGFTAFVVVYEEPTLRATFGKQYETYCSNVGRWIPRLSPWTQEGRPGI
jgi:protein-S-isoprenylcysteine O-methyltransferase Ste14